MHYQSNVLKATRLISRKTMTHTSGQMPVARSSLMWWKGSSGSPVVIADHSFDVVEFGLQVLAALLLHLVFTALQSQWEIHQITSSTVVRFCEKSWIQLILTLFLSFSALYSSMASCYERMTEVSNKRSDSNVFHMLTLIIYK